MEAIASEMLAQLAANSHRPFNLIYRRVGNMWVRICRSTEPNSYPWSLSVDSTDLDPIERDIVYDWAIAFGAPEDVDLFHYNGGSNWYVAWNVTPETAQETPQVN